MCTLAEFRELKGEMKHYAKQDEMKKALQNLKQVIERQQITISDKLVQKQELNKTDVTLRKWCKESFEDKENFTKKMNDFNGKMAKME